MNNQYTINLITPATQKVVTLSEVKKFLRISSCLPGEDEDPVSTIAPGSHSIGTVTGTAIDISGYNVYIQLDSRTNGTGGTVDLKIMESADNSNFTEWSGIGFTQITIANDNQFYNINYTGSLQYLRIDATVAVAACSFGVNVVLASPICPEDDVLTDIIDTVQGESENFQNRSFLTSTWELVLNDWPKRKSPYECYKENYIELWRYPLQSVTSIKYYDTGGVEHTFAASNYYVDTNAKPGRIVLKYGCVWPSETLQYKSGIVIQFVAGYTDLAEFKEQIKGNTTQWIKAACKYLYDNRDKTLQEFPYRALETDRIGCGIG